ncbi:hypothetical protein AC578_6886 [Lecanosticta acicola]|uniref:DUF4396 domain-containing protein n=1 Tax=Lecanosticta acicola TaxID=111012 RepID=A0AAI8W0Z0_9PEZI|nr:hypothetical protein AC578_6886 [Lecanosticta acicola]
MNSPYHEPLALVIISSISISLGAVAAGFILGDILLRRGWRSMMGVMIPVYVINALYLWPLTLWVYLQYGRPPKPSKEEAPRPQPKPHCHASSPQEPAEEEEEEPRPKSHCAHHAPPSKEPEEEGDHCHDRGSERPMFATLTVAVCHCGAGCVLGDIIGEWLVYGTNTRIDGEMLWPAYLIDFAFAIALGLVFQYFSIAPMSGEYGPKTLYRAAKADFFSLLFFEIGLFAWMASFQIAIFHYKLEMNTVTYWWLMQIGMFFGHWTAVPINWWLIKTGVKEPCC